MIRPVQRQRRAWLRGSRKYVLIVFIGLAAVALFLLASASANTSLFSRHYSLLLKLNVGLVICLALLVLYQLWILWRKLRRRVFGSKLTLRLVLLFGLMAVIPGAVVYAVSFVFIGQSIESWFDVRVDKALEGGLNIGRSTLDNMLMDLTHKANAMALSLSSRPSSEYITSLNSLREQAGVPDATLFSVRGKIVAYSGTEHSGLVPDLPKANALRQMRLQRNYSAIESLPGRGLYLRVLVPVSTLNLADDLLVLQLLEPVPPQITHDAEIVQKGYTAYQELTKARLGLKRLYGVTLTLVLFLALLSALLLAFLLSDRLSAPLGILAEGTRAVAQGDFSQRAAVAGRDELGMLTQSFNSMTLQLAEARAVVEHNQAQLAQAKGYLESLLGNLSAGVMAFDEHLRLRSHNVSADHILGADFQSLTGIGLTRWPQRLPALASFAEAVAAAFNDKTGEWEQQLEREAAGGTQMLLLRGTRLTQGVDSGYVVVFDDITHLLQAQRDAAWAEVARRLAHEIKNPLTPIQLSAERLELKLAPRLAEDEAQLLSRATATIVNQVSALKRMVNAFSQYARMPEPSRSRFDLNALVREVLALYESARPRIVLSLASALPQVEGDTAQLRQVIHNLLQNAQDALAEAPAPSIEVSTALVDDTVQLAVADNGSGFPEQMMKRAFEPYVTTKPKGTGLGLAIVRKIVEEHGGTVTVEAIVPHGARVIVTLPLSGQPAAFRPHARV
jgi:nitrogen fixation/metabolism regulation signal transduction histidine kinase